MSLHHIMSCSAFSNASINWTVCLSVCRLAAQCSVHGASRQQRNYRAT